MKVSFHFLTALALALAPALAHAQPAINIIQIWQNFLASRAAAITCNAVDPGTKTQFEANLIDVTIRAGQSILQNDPSISQADLPVKMKTVGDGISSKVNDEISQNGCKSPKIDQLLKLYKMHSTMKL